MEKLQDIQYKMKDFSDEVLIWLNSDDCDNFIRKISEIHRIDYDKIWDLVIMLIQNDFYIGPLEVDIQEKFQIDEVKAMSVALDIIGMIFYPIAGYIKDFYDIEAELKERGSSGGAYSAYAERAKLVMDRVVMDHLSKQVEIYEKEAASPEEISNIKDLFASDLVDILRVGTGEATAVLNVNIIYALQSNPRLKMDLLHIIEQSPEILTNKQFRLDGKVAGATVGNWISDIVAQTQGRILDSIALSDYMARSGNVAALDDSERRLVSRLFLTYRNIKGFPEFFANIPPEQWEIIPIERREQPSPAKIAEVAMPQTAKIPLTKEQMQNMSPIEKMITMQEYGVSEADWQKMIS